MELINEFKNRYVLALSDVLNRLCNEENFSKDEIGTEIQEAAGVEKYSAFGTNFLQTVMTDNGILLDLSDKSHILPVREGKIRFPLSRMEKIYLLMMLESRYMPLFLDEAEIASLHNKLQEEKIPDFSPHISIHHVRKGDEITPEFVQKIRLIQKAIHEKRSIRYDNLTRNGLLTDRTSLPLRIEFSAMDQTFRVSMWSPDGEGRAVKANISRLSNITLLESSDMTDRNIAEILKSRLAPEPIIMRIRNRKKAPERAAQMFSMYDSMMEPLENGDWQMCLRYYEFDKLEIRQHILSFGPSVQVLSPAWLVEEICEYLKQ